MTAAIGTADNRLHVVELLFILPDLQGMHRYAYCMRLQLFLWKDFFNAIAVPITVEVANMPLVAILAQQYQTPCAMKKARAGLHVTSQSKVFLQLQYKSPVCANQSQETHWLFLDYLYSLGSS